VRIRQVRLRKTHHCVEIVSDALSFGRLWYTQISHAISDAQFYSRSHVAVIHVYDAAGNLIQTHEHKGEFKEC
jgi:hypothetical protein